MPSPSDRTITLHVADGSSHEAKMMTLDSVRVGKFTVRNVECAVSSKEKSNVPPLLGGPFLKHFTFKMNQAAGTVTFSKIETPETAASKSTRKGKTVAPSRRGVGRPGRSTAPAAGRTTPREEPIEAGEAWHLDPPSGHPLPAGEGEAALESGEAAVGGADQVGHGEAVRAGGLGGGEVGRGEVAGDRRQGLVEGAGFLPLAVDLVIAEVAEHGRHGDALGRGLAEVAAAVAVEVGGLLRDAPPAAALPWASAGRGSPRCSRGGRCGWSSR